MINVEISEQQRVLKTNVVESRVSIVGMATLVWVSVPTYRLCRVGPTRFRLLQLQLETANLLAFVRPYHAPLMEPNC